MDIFIISLAAFAVSILTFFSGFGLGTALTPVFMVFLPVELAIALTAVVVSTFVDFTRLSIYATRFTKPALIGNLPLVTCATLAGIAGAYLGNRLLKKVTLRFLQVTVAVMLIVISLALGAGLI